MAKGSGSSYPYWYRRTLYEPICPSLADYLDMEKISVIVRKECVPVRAEEEGERERKSTLRKKRKI